ncbi:helix-hairpin-helix domain-containing protein [Thermoproteota archaeon]
MTTPSTNHHIKIIILITVVLFIGISVSLYQRYFKPLSSDYIQVIPQRETKPTSVLDTRTNINQTSPSKIGKVITLPNSKESIHDNLFIYVHIAGCIKKPGVYKLKKDSRLVDLIQIAGNCLENADMDTLNLAQKLTDSQRVFIPPKNTAASLPGTGPHPNTRANPPDSIRQNSSAKTLINLNTATLSELKSIPGIGPKIAQAIVNLRSKHTAFISINDLLNVKGIGPKTLKKISPYIVVE